DPVRSIPPSQGTPGRGDDRDLGPATSGEGGRDGCNRGRDLGRTRRGRSGRNGRGIGGNRRGGGGLGRSRLGRGAIAAAANQESEDENRGERAPVVPPHRRSAYCALWKTPIVSEFASNHETSHRSPKRHRR